MDKLINIGGKERAVNFGRSFWSEVETITGKTITELLDVKELTSIRNQNAIAFASLKWGAYKDDGKEPSIDFTLINVSKWIDQNDKVMYDFYNYLTESLPKNANAEAKTPQ